ncbi:hypothetical protein V6N13_118525 [Hibiscus sabdariffa]|uniref:Uncharacterized protein n=1 Tax=Hibiscus sabdariffa TaxID=183260 RepID=A0ABR2BS62_9ROSI
MRSVFLACHLCPPVYDQTNLGCKNSIPRMDLIFSICLFILLSMLQGISGTAFTLVNKCDHTVWPAILGNTQLDTTGFELLSAGSRSIQGSPSWSGRFWGRTKIRVNSPAKPVTVAPPKWDAMAKAQARRSP